MIKEEKTYNSLHYIIRYPENFVNGKKYPILFFMHGAGTRGNNIKALLDNPFFEITDKYENFPFITIAPQCYKDSWFDIFETVLGLVNHIYDCGFTDKKRVYAMGASMGGYAVWQMAMSLPEIFAAIIPVCGGGMYWNAGQLKSVPAWAFHGDSDEVVFTEESIKMVNAVNNNFGKAKLTIYENCDHNSWNKTYKNEKVFDWLLNNIKTQNTFASNNFNDSKIYG